MWNQNFLLLQKPRLISTKEDGTDPQMGFSEGPNVSKSQEPVKELVEETIEEPGLDATEEMDRQEPEHVSKDPMVEEQNSEAKSIEIPVEPTTEQKTIETSFEAPSSFQPKNE